MKNKTFKVRKWVQIFFFALIAFIAINHTLIENGGGIALLSSASLHALCPFGGVVTIYQYFSDGTFIKKIHESSFILMIIGFILAVGFGPLFCGWICPFGTFQEWIAKIGKKLFGKKYNKFIPYKYDKYLRYLRYIVLARVLYMTAISAEIVFADVDPYFALFNFWTSEVSVASIIILLLVMISSLFVERPWCKYVCPYGALLGITNLFRSFKIRTNKNTCISCKACDNICPMNIKVSEHEVILDHQCISCMQCSSENACPIADTVNLSTKGGK
ncbi:4Fe-4S binding protein [Clostridium sp.]|uniref:4Fe-4S binding protein n=1 Tax=Clostridium sp. TaxID=1506 RepID=UPI001A49BE39|nr:4Fe-4S binding protein [Clostridium sp.]MBK5240009.1 4Fe-4S binding protein [Clostridium sp.]